MSSVEFAVRMRACAFRVKVYSSQTHIIRVKIFRYASVIDDAHKNTRYKTRSLSEGSCDCHASNKNSSLTTDLTAEARREILAYFSGALKTFSVPISLEKASAKQADVLNMLLKIPYGGCVSYGEIASKVNSSPRAVGAYCAKNPLPFFVPCHRVIRSNGEVGGYCGSSNNLIKHSLIEIEQKNS
ncbi:methylated-DNA--[protein]-cysteine S-methyltransferase [Tropheryma whipplei]|uniref:methylated-DNA--[protein]-cysteine S-methyltransferase n=2 Tax=Tropheryma whipplei TaxID=2039 RepID=UPI0004B1AB2F|nr:methylated-DNA--[protein]-cysteine S-methyltransferase [Tropheryma whipplei]